MLAIGGQSFLSAAVGLAIGVAVIRGFTSRSGQALGNFWVDRVRASADFPVATYAAIKTLGSVGGGFFNVNSAHPFETATWFSSLVQALLIISSRPC
jgi:K+-transporting ATPase ATPase A chain